MGNPTTVPIISPDGRIGDVPYARMKDAIAAGGKPGVTVKSPDGRLGVIPSDRMPDAVKAGGTIVPFESQETQHPGFWKTLADDVKGMATGAYRAVTDEDPLADPNVSDAEKERLLTQSEANAAAKNASRTQAHGAPYSYAANAGEMLGVNVPGMEKSAEEGDVGGVAAHAAAVPAVMAATEGVTKGAPAAADLAKPYFDKVVDSVSGITPKQAAQAVGAGAGAVAGHGTLSPAGAYYGAKTAGRMAEGVLGPERANAPIIKPKVRPVYPGAPLPEDPGVFPGAGLPESPAPELLQGNSLLNPGAAPAPEPSAGLGKIPVQAPEVAAPENRLPAAFQPVPRRPPAVPGTVDAPFQVPAEPEAAPETRLPAAFQPLPPKAPPVPGTVDLPFKSLMELPPVAVDQAIQEVGAGAGISQITERANRIALKNQLEGQLNDAVGYKPPVIEPGKPIYQRPGYKAEAPVSVPEGMTPVESSALRSYHYDPDTQTFTAQMRSGSMYRWAEVTPDEAADFADAKSKGQALSQIRNNHVNTQANYGQGWINRQPLQRSASPTDIAPGAEPEASSTSAASPSDDLTDLLQKSLAQAREKSKLPKSGAQNAAAQAPEAAQSAASPVPSQPANGRTGAGAAVYEPRQPEFSTASGASTNIKVPGSAQSYPARYEVRELADVQPSHSGTSFRPNRRYALVNDRDYSNPANQAKVIDNSAAGKFDPSCHLTDNPDATNGPIVIDSDGHALAGNGRAMILQRVYKQNPEGAAQYRMMLANKSPQFGVDPMAVIKMKEPVLVRQIADEDLPHTDAKQNAITDFNKVGTAQLTPSERAITDSRRVSQDTLDSISAHLEAAGPDANLSDVLQGKAGTAILDKLIQDGVISPQERAALATENGLTPAAKERVGKLATGRFFRDPAQMDSTPPAIRSKLEAIAAPLARVDGIEGWDLTPHVQQALDLLEEARTHNLTNVRDAVSQSRLFGDEQYSPRAITLAEQLKNTGARTLVKQLRLYAQDAQDATGAQQTFGQPVTPQQAFREAMGTGSEGEQSRPFEPEHPNLNLGEHAEHVEMVPVEKLAPYREFDRRTEPRGEAGYIDEVKEDIRKNGIKEPLILKYGVNDQKVSLDDGNHRLGIAQELGLKEVPVRVKIALKTDADLGKPVAGYQGGFPVPDNLKPSEIGLKGRPVKVRSSAGALRVKPGSRAISAQPSAF